MNYLNDERLDALAADYVMGTMEGRARRRFVRLMQTYQKVRERVWHWEQLLAPMNARIEDQMPPERVWQEISRRVGFIDTTQVAANDAAPLKGLMAWAGGFATAAVLLLGVFLLRPDPVMVPAAMTEQMAVFTQGEQPLWLMEVSGNELTVQATAAVQASDEHDYELWIVPEDGSAPVSLGLMPENGRITRALAVNTHDIAIKAVAVSLEAPGGSVTGAPGEVLYVTGLTIL
ncbi:MAG: anti-sigma factor [Thalassolituus sp.]